MDRHADVVEILETAADSRVRTLSLNGSLTSNAAPDLTDVDPSGNLVFTAFRGPTPLSGDSHNAKGDTRIDNPYGDRNLICACPPIEAYV